MKTKNILKILIISLIIILSYCTNSYCEESTPTIKMQVNNDAAWVEINLSDMYSACQDLNSTTSTLGTSALEAHLTTAYDWSILSVLYKSQYKNSNDSGVKYYIPHSNVERTSTILDTRTASGNFAGLFNSDGTLKKYVNKITSDGYETLSDGATRRLINLVRKDDGTLIIPSSRIFRERCQSWEF